MSSPQSYVAGLLFDRSGSTVALIRKLKPAWQVGKLNAIGGKIELGETPIGAMHWEFSEEAGVTGLSWDCAAILSGDGLAVHFFAAFDDRICEARTVEAERVEFWTVRHPLLPGQLIPNLQVIIPIALDRTGIAKPVRLYDGALPGEGS